MEAVMHLLVGEGSGGAVPERTVYFGFDEEDRDASFVNDVVDSEIEIFDTLVPGCYLEALRGGEELEQDGIEGSIPVVLFCSEAINEREMIYNGFGPRHICVPSD
jgi:hypothetical protein